MTDRLCSEEEAREIFERARWPNRPVCPKCGAIGQAAKLATRPGLWSCKACRACQYSATSGTPLHGSRVGLDDWLQLVVLLEFEGVTPAPSQLSRALQLPYSTARSMAARLNDLEMKMPLMFAGLVSLIVERRKALAA